MRFRNRGCESLEFERVNERIEQLIQNQLHWYGGRLWCRDSTGFGCSRIHGVI